VWFQSNPLKTRLRRNEAGNELPRDLRGLGIVEVLIERAGSKRFIRTFFDHTGRPVAAALDHFKHTVVQGAPEHTIHGIPGGPVAVDRADTTSIDREYFEQNPDSNEYERDALPIELEQAQASLGFRPRSGRVRVTQLVPGFRVTELLRTSE
jgi:hypothetical protein